MATLALAQEDARFSPRLTEPLSHKIFENLEGSFAR
jgi:hypothetical protein